MSSWLSQAGCPIGCGTGAETLEELGLVGWDSQGVCACLCALLLWFFVRHGFRVWGGLGIGFVHSFSGALLDQICFLGLKFGRV